MGRQPFGLASPAAWLRREGAEVTCLDLSQQHLDRVAVRRADLVAFYLPMHTATRIAAIAIARVRSINAEARLCAYGLYAPLNADLLRRLGIHDILGGEFEEGLAALVRRNNRGQVKEVQREISLARQQFMIPDRSNLPPLRKYAKLALPDGAQRIVGYTEASRGCLHRCRHCPIVPVYQGAFRIVQRDVVLADIRQQVAMGAEHITFGDPDFLNGPAHSLAIVRALHREFPQLTYDITAKVEHLLKYRQYLPVLRQTRCAVVTSAIESVDDRVLALLEKGHSRADFYELVRLFREAGLPLAPTFVAFTPWITPQGYEDLLASIAELGLIHNVAPVQLTLRLLIPARSRLLELPEMEALVQGFDENALRYRWQHPDPRMDQLQGEVERRVQQLSDQECDRGAIFAEVFRMAQQTSHGHAWQSSLPKLSPPFARTSIPYLTEPWYC